MAYRRGMGAAAALPLAGALLCLLALGGVHGKDEARSTDLFDEVAVHHFHVPAPSAQTGTWHPITAPSLHALEMQAVDKVRQSRTQGHAPAKQMHSLSEAAQGSLLKDAEKEMQQEEGSFKQFSNARMSNGHQQSESQLAVDKDHGNVPMKIMQEAMQLAKERDDLALPASQTLSARPMTVAAKSGLLEKALKEQQADRAKASQFDQELSPKAKVSEAAEAEDKDHGHVSLKWLKLAQKLAKEQGQSLVQENRDVTPQPPKWQAEAEDKMHGKVAGWQLALMKKLKEERQQDDEKMNRPLAEEMQKEGYVWNHKEMTPEQFRAEKMKKLAEDHTNLGNKKLATLAQKAVQERNEDEQKVEKPLADQMVEEGYLKNKRAPNGQNKEAKRAKDTTQLHPKKAVTDYVKEASKAKAERDADDKKMNKPLADQMVKEGYLKDERAPKVQSKEAKIAKDLTQLHHKEVTDYVKEASEAKAERDADDKKVEKPLADQMVREGYLHDERARTFESKEAKLAKDTTQLHPKKAVTDYVKEVNGLQAERKADYRKVEKPLAEQMVREGYLKDERGAQNMHEKMKVAAKDLTQLHPKEVTDYVKEASEAKADRDADDKKVQKPLAEAMVREGYLHEKGYRYNKMEERAKDHTNMKTINMNEVAGLAGKAKLHLYNNRKGPSSQGTKLIHKEHVDYVKEAMEAKAERDADDVKLQKPLADAMVREGYLRAPGGSRGTMAERAIDHTKMPTINAKEVQHLTGAQLQHRNAANIAVGQKLNHGGRTDYVKEAMEAKAEKEADDEKIERPLAETMVREGYLAHKGPALAERAIDHTKMSATTIKEIAGLASVKLQHNKVYNGQQLNHHSHKTTDYVKEAMKAKAEKDADDQKIQKPLADAMVREGYLEKEGGMGERAVDHTKLKGNAKNGVTGGQKLSPAARAARVAQGQADFLKDAMAANAMKDAEDAKVQAPLAREMVKQGYLKPHNVITNPYRQPAASKPVVHPPAHPKMSLSSNAAKSAPSAESQKEEAERLLKIVNRSVYHDKSPAIKSHAKTVQNRQSKLVNLAMKAEEERAQEDKSTAETMKRDIKAEKQHDTRTALSMKDTIQTSNKLIQEAIKEQQDARAKGKAEMRLDDKALEKREGAKAHQAAATKKGDNLFEQAVKEAQADRAKGKAERDRDIKMSAPSHQSLKQHAATTKPEGMHKGHSLIQDAIREQDAAMQKGIQEEEIDNKIVNAARRHTGAQGEKKSLIKLARQAMGEIDEDEAVKQARLRKDDEAEVVLHREHVEAREKAQLDKEVSVKAVAKTELKSRDSMLMLISKAESEVAKDKSLAAATK